MRLVSFGEALFRFSVPAGQRLRDADQLDFFIGGCELSVAANCAALGQPAAWVSVLPQSPEGDLILQRISCLGLDLRHVVRGPGGAGYYFMEQGSSPRPDYEPSRRASLLGDGLEVPFDWDTILQGAHVFHTSGASAGLGPRMRQEMQSAFEAARRLGVGVSYDCHFRANQWSLEEARVAQTPLLGNVDILFGSLSDLRSFFDVTPNEIASFVRSRKLSYLVLGDREEGTYGVSIWTPQGVTRSRRFPYVSLDRVGIGDSMAAGFLSALESGNPQVMADWAAACGALKYTLRGDMALLRREEVERTLQTDHAQR